MTASSPVIQRLMTPVGLRFNTTKGSPRRSFQDRQKLQLGGTSQLVSTISVRFQPIGVFQVTSSSTTVQQHDCTERTASAGISDFSSSNAHVASRSPLSPLMLPKHGRVKKTALQRPTHGKIRAESIAQLRNGV